MFRIKNITEFTIVIEWITLRRKESVDLTTTLSNTTISDSLLSGELYHKIQGRMISILSPPQDWNSIGLTTAQFSRITHAGFFQGYLSREELKPPFSFNDDGYLHTFSSVIGEVSVRGIVADGGVADGFPVEIGGVDESGNTHSVSVNSDGYLHVAGTSAATFGPVADGLPAYGYPVEIGGVDEDGYIQSVSVNGDGYLYVAGTSTATFGPVADGLTAYGYPVEIVRVDEDGYIQSIAHISFRNSCWRNKSGGNYLLL